MQRSQEKQGSKLEPKLGERLQEVYDLRTVPKDISSFADLWHRRLNSSKRARNFIASVREGKQAIGETDAERGYSISHDGKRVNVMCGLDALATAYLRNGGFIHASCPHCGMKMDAQIVEKRIINKSPASMIFWLGTGPKNSPGHPCCDHLHLFPSEGHLGAWLRTRKDELGVKLPIDQALELGRLFDM